MKNIIYIFFIAYSGFAQAQNISKFAGNGSSGNTGDNGLATAAAIDYPVTGVFDKFGNYYIATGQAGNTIRKISPIGIITTVAGTGLGGYNGDGIPATNAELDNPQSVTVDTFGNFYFTDNFNSRIRKVDIITGLISTICGTGTIGFSGDGMPATSAMIHGPLDICFDRSGNLFFADYGNSRVRKINSAGIISTYAGGGSGTGDSGPATAAGIGAWGLCVDDSDNLYIANGSKKVFKVNTSGVISRYAGTNTSGYSGDGGPATSAQTGATYVRMDRSGNLFISEYGFNTIRMVNNLGIITTIAGTYGMPGASGDGGPSSASLLNYPAGLNFDTCGNLYIADSRNLSVRKITYDTSCHPYDGSNTLNIDMEFLVNTLVFPNPVKSTLTISTLSKAIDISIADPLGNITYYNKTIADFIQVDFSLFPSGLYFVKIKDQYGAQTIKKIIKQ